MQFTDLTGQQLLQQNLTDMVRQNRLSHALLFLGKEGSGALGAALAFSQYLVCVDKQGDDSCGVCAACIKAGRYMHPDIHYSYPVIPKKAGDKPVSTDYIREWREVIQLYSYGNSFDWL